MRRITKMLGAEPADSFEDALLVESVQSVCLSVGVSPPEVLVIPEEKVANAVVMCNGPREAVLIATRGLGALLDPVELEGIVAHELVHVRRSEARTATRVALGSGLLWARLHKSAWQPGGKQWSKLGDQREIQADLLAAQATRYPPGLVNALEKIAPVSVLAPAKKPDGPVEPALLERWMGVWAITGLWVAPAVEDKALSESFAMRLAVLAEL
jgi:Zn-dependent protease with chaperone function